MIRRDQKGLAAIVISLVLVTLLSAVAISFAVLMNREAHKSLNNQLGQAAYDAAASGINDTISYLRDNPSTNVTQCQDLIGSGKPLNAAADLSGNGNTKYTCALVNTRPRDLSYQSINAYQSQVIRLSVAGPTGNGDIMTKMMLSWQATNRSYASFVPSPQAGQLFDETTWNNSRFAPLMRVAIYPVPADTKDLTYATNNSSTYFLYPINAPVGSSVTSLPLSTASGTLQNINCGGGAKNTGGFSGSADYDCNVILTGLPTSDVNGYQYFVRLTPYYSNADAKIKGNDASAQPISFVGTQAVVDVTAQSSSAVKRLQARVDISRLNGNSQDIAPSDNAIPEFALRQPNTVCKRLQNPSDASLPVYIDDTSISYCGLDLSKLKPPTVNINASPPTVTPGGSSNLTWTSTNADSCTASGGWSGTKPTNDSASTGALSATTTFTLTCHNAAGDGPPGSVTVTVNQPPPPPSFTFGADSTLLDYNGSTTLRWSTSNVTWCWGHGGTWGEPGWWKTPTGGSDPTGNLTSSQTYYLQCGQPGNPAPTQSFTITVKPQGGGGGGTGSSVCTQGSLSLSFRASNGDFTYTWWASCNGPGDYYKIEGTGAPGFVGNGAQSQLGNVPLSQVPRGQLCWVLSYGNAQFGTIGQTTPACDGGTLACSTTGCNATVSVTNVSGSCNDFLGTCTASYSVCETANSPSGGCGNGYCNVNGYQVAWGAPWFGRGYKTGDTISVTCIGDNGGTGTGTGKFTGSGGGETCTDPNATNYGQPGTCTYPTTTYYTCWNGTRVTDLSQCPQQPVTCWDGTSAPTLSACPPRICTSRGHICLEFNPPKRLKLALRW